MTTKQRHEIKDALLQCAKENENRNYTTSHIVVSSICRSAKERIEELEQQIENMKVNGQLLKAKEIIKDLIDSLIVIDGEQVRELKTVKEAERFLNTKIE